MFEEDQMLNFESRGEEEMIPSTDMTYELEVQTEGVE